MEKKKRWYQSISNWLMILAVGILVPILLMNLSILFQANTDKEKIPSVFGYKPFIVLSGSMETDIRVGDLIITKEVDPTTLVVGDVIAFRDAQGTVTTHRIIEMVDCHRDTCFITKGDNNSSQDQNLVELDDVEGIYITRIPGVGNMLNSLSEPTTILIVVLGISVIFAVAFMISNKKQLSQEQLEFLAYKKQKDLAKKEKEDEEFLEFKRQKELKEQEEFLEFKKQKEQAEEVKKATTKKTTKSSSSKTAKVVKEDTKPKTTRTSKSSKTEDSKTASKAKSKKK